jgi:protocatechuate 3,4-dioxygenase beta subunit
MPHSRRVFLARAGAIAVAPLVATPVLADGRPTTPKMTRGPFYPRGFPADIDADLTRVAGQSGIAAGTILDVSGRVMDRRGAPVAGARMEIWQCDHAGRYLHVGDLQPDGDPRFQGFGATTVDAEGRYRFRTIRPSPYPGRTPHIHFLVRTGPDERLVSQMFLEGEPGNARDGLYRWLRDDARLVTMKLEDAPRESGAKLRGSLDIVIA